MDETIYKRSSKGKDLQKDGSKPIKIRFKNKTVNISKSIRIGRGQHNDIVLDDDPLVSRKHAVMERTENSCTIMDLGSTNGTYLNGDPLKTREPKKLKTGCVIKIGNTEFTFLG